MRPITTILGPSHSGDSWATISEHRPDGKAEAVQLWLPLTVDGGGLANMRIGKLVTGGIGVKMKVEFDCPRCDTMWTEHLTLWNFNLHNRCTLTEFYGVCHQCEREFDPAVLVSNLSEQFFIDPDVLLGGPF